jgi:callose synthase
VEDNWERLVRAVLKQDWEHLRACEAAGGLGMAAAVPTSLGRTSNIEQILQDPNVARIRRPNTSPPLLPHSLLS